MAKITAFTALDITGLDLNGLLTSDNVDVENDVNTTVNGTVYEDAILFYDDAPSPYPIDIIAGSGFVIGANNIVSAGTITGFAHGTTDGTNLLPQWLVEGLSFSLKSFAAAAFTADTSDDLAVLAGMLAGNDTFNLSNGNDVIAAFGGNDIINGKGGADVLFGNDGNDKINGGGGTDVMAGGAGNDVYFVDNTGDQVFETTSTTTATDAGGTDTVNSSISFDLGATAGVSFVEKLNLIGSKAIDGTGNTLGNVIVGNQAANRIDGAGGSDKLFGLAGNDTLIGGAGGDTLTGGAGKDRMSGGSGSDKFVFGWSDFSGSDATTADVITDFKVAQNDKIVLVRPSQSNLPVPEFVYIGQDAFHGVAGEVRYEFLGDTKTLISGDTDGNGTADFAILLLGHVSLNEGSFLFT